MAELRDCASDEARLPRHITTIAGDMTPFGPPQSHRMDGP